MKKVLLLFPPEWVPTAPYLALPSLTAVLRQHGVETVQKDVNVEMFDYIFSKKFLEFVLARIKTNLKDLKRQAASGTLDEEQTQQIEILEQYKLIDLEHHIHKVTRAKAIMRSPEFYEVDKAEWALNAFREVTELLSVAYYPASINFYPVESNLNAYRPWVSDEVLKAPFDRKVNIYADICEQLVFPAIEEEKPDIVGISLGTPLQFMSGTTFATLIRQKYPDVHVTVGGNIVTRLKTELSGMKKFFDQAYDSIIFYEGEHSLLKLVQALDGQTPMSEVPNCAWRDEAGEVHVNSAIQNEKITDLPIADFDGFPWEKYFSPERLVPYLGTRGCYWGKCTFCDHGAGYIDQYRAKHADQIVNELEFLAKKYDAKHFIFTDESFPPAMFIKLPPLIVERGLDIYWTTLIRFEESLKEPAIWDMAAKSGCRSLYFGLESANERIIKLIKKDTKIDVAIQNLNECKRVGIWSHLMGFFGFPTETVEEGNDTRDFLLGHQEIIDSVEMYFFVLYKNAPVWDFLDDLNVKPQVNPEHDLALDYYYTPESGVNIPEAVERYENFYKNDFDPWALRINAREHIFLYITHYGAKELPQLYVKNHSHASDLLAPEVMM